MENKEINYWRIGVGAGEDLIARSKFEEGFPYAWGSGIFGAKYIENFKKVEPGDVLVAGKVKRGQCFIEWIGEVKKKPVYLYPSKEYGECLKSNFPKADASLYEEFQDICDEAEDKESDIICIEVKWYTIDWSKINLPRNFSSRIGIFHPLDYAGKELVKKILQKQKGETMQKYTDLLKANKNLILTGAPGTGKTYLARKIGEAVAEKSPIEFVQFHPSYDYTDFVEGLRPADTGNGQIGFKLEDGIFKAFCKNAAANPKQEFVFIIDEINRGEISKIFGELFFAVDPGYRGITGAVKTQYSNLIPEGDVFKEGFYVPENVYIIGTMNDIDRSVESFDFAMRRRFTFIEITAEESAENMGLSAECKGRMDALNTAISKIEGLTSAYHIGGEYFLKKDKNENVIDPDFDDLWNTKLKFLLSEYLRGMSAMNDNLVALKEAYDLESKTDDTGNNHDGADNG